MLRTHQLGPADQGLSEPAADGVIDSVARDGRHGKERDDGGKVHFTHGADGASDKEQGIAGKEVREDQAGFGKNDDKEQGIDPVAVICDELQHRLVDVKQEV